jgi:hypothetical protein
MPTGPAALGGPHDVAPPPADGNRDAANWFEVLANCSRSTVISSFRSWFSSWLRAKVVCNWRPSISAYDGSAVAEEAESGGSVAAGTATPGGGTRLTGVAAVGF